MSVSPLPHLFTPFGSITLFLSSPLHHHSPSAHCLSFFFLSLSLYLSLSLSLSHFSSHSPSHVFLLFHFRPPSNCRLYLCVCVLTPLALATPPPLGSTPSLFLSLLLLYTSDPL